MFKKNNCYFVLIFSSLLLISCKDSAEIKKMKYEAALVRIDSSMQVDDFVGVIKNAKQAIDVYDSISLPHSYKALAHYKLNEVDDAIDEAEKVIEIEGDQSYGAKILALIDYNKKNKPKKALEHAQNYYKYDNTDLENVYLLGNIYRDLDEPQKAITYYTTTINEKYNTKEGLNNRAKLNVVVQKFDNAILDFKLLKSISDSTEYGKLDFILGEIYQKNQNYELSNESFFKTDSIISDKLISYNYLQLSNTDSALVYINKYISVEPNDIDAYKSRYQILKTANLSDADLYMAHKDLKRQEWNDYGAYKYFILAGCMLMFYFLCHKIAFKNIKINYYDKRNTKTAFKQAFGFMLGGSFRYTQFKPIIVIACITTAVLLTYIVTCIFLNFGNDYFIEYIADSNIFKFTLMVLLLVFIIDLVTIFSRIKNSNIRFRKSLNIEILVNRKQNQAQLIHEIKQANTNLKQLLQP